MSYAVKSSSVWSPTKCTYIYIVQPHTDLTQSITYITRPHADLNQLGKDFWPVHTQLYTDLNQPHNYLIIPIADPNQVHIDRTKSLAAS